MAFVGAFHGEALALQEFSQQRAKLDVIVHQQDVHSVVVGHASACPSSNLRSSSPREMAGGNVVILTSLSFIVLFTILQYPSL